MKKLSVLFLAVLLMTASCREILEEIKKLPKDDEPKKEAPSKFKEIGSITLGGEGAAEISAYDAETTQLFVVNNDGESRIDVVDLEDPTQPVLLKSIDITPFGAGVNSVAVSDGLLAAAIEADPAQAEGKIVFFDTQTCAEVTQANVGALPDMVIFSPDGQYALSANEGEPSGYEAGDEDPLGSLSIIEVQNGFVTTTLDFKAFNGMEKTLAQEGFRVFGPGATLAQDVEPEYIAVSENSRTAWISLQENNGLARIDLESKTITEIIPLGLKDYALAENAMDASDEDGIISLNTWPVWGVYQPDAIAAYSVNGLSYIISANEGDAREYNGFEEEIRVEDVVLDPLVFPYYEELQKEENLGRLQITSTLGDTDNDGEYEELYAFGGRSFSIWDGLSGQQVFDSGNEVEKLIIEAGLYDDGRSDAKGVEPEGVTIGKIGQRTIAFIGLERVDAIMVYDVTNPFQPQFLQILESGDAPEGLVFVPAEDSPAGKSLLIVSSEDDGQVKIFQP
ncbi:hypothetical protein OKW21_005607 [Catalinimonas alkaloidigena]|uniref:choice-of-anchor I family protein n=1 Tax=Catalinimonas alkaloidigena TaxID=1075417 RepID=UPI002406AA79|nr:choice-of-anchor I family protein [Catalinimonas alkaloidigena]MDF9800344.1 hypothetical protein [Catalinimonas alkaloidigena]